MTNTFQYSSIGDRYLSRSGLIFTADELDYFTDLERDWKRTLPDYSFDELLEIFPQAKSIVKKKLKSEIKQAELDIIEGEQMREDIKDALEWKSRYPEDWTPILEGIFVTPLIKGKQELIKKNQYLLSRFNKKVEEPTGGVTDKQIAQARNKPIKDVIVVNVRGKAVCIFHNDHDPSIQVYKDNHFYCFVCNKRGDVIDLQMKLTNQTFINAVKALL